MIISGYIASSYLLFDPAPYSTASIIFNAILTGGLPTFSFIMSGASVAPHFKKSIAITLSILIIVIILPHILREGYQTYTNDGIVGILLSWEYILKSISEIVGPIIASVLVNKQSQ